MKNRMYCTELEEWKDEEQIIQMALIRDGIFRKMEDALAKAIRPESGDRPVGSLLKRQKREIKALFEMYRYIVVSLGESYESAQKEEQRLLWKKTEAALETTEVKERLQKKFELFF